MVVLAISDPCTEDSGVNTIFDADDSSVRARLDKLRNDQLDTTGRQMVIQVLRLQTGFARYSNGSLSAVSNSCRVDHATVRDLVAMR